MQKCWRKTLYSEDMKKIQATSSSVAEEWRNTIITKSYSKNPLDDFGDFDDDDEAYWIDKGTKGMC